MKYFITSIIALSLLFAGGCSMDSADTTSKITPNSKTRIIANGQFVSVDAEDGDISSNLEVNTTRDGSYDTGMRLRVGVDNGVNYKAIITVDSSSLNNFNTVQNAVLSVGPFFYSSRPDNDVWLQYLQENLVIEFAPSYGFTGSYFLPNYSITAASYSAAAVAEFAFVYSPADNGFKLPQAANYYINKTGKTQMRISFKNNPNNYFIGLVEYNSNQGVALLTEDSTVGRWQAVGEEGFSGGQTKAIAYAYDNNTAYATYSAFSTDCAHLNYFCSPKVYKNSGSDWSQLGNSDYYAYSSGLSKLVVENGNVYVLHAQFDSHRYYKNVTMFKLVAGTWQQLGATTAVPGVVKETLKLIVNNGIPFIAYSPYPYTEPKTFVTKFENGLWQQVGSTALADNSKTVDIKADATGLYAVISEEAASGTGSDLFLKKFNGSDWVDGANFPVIESVWYDGFELYVINGLVYVTIKDIQAVVRSFNGYSWSNLGAAFPDFNMNTSYIPKLVFRNGLINAAYVDLRTNKLHVKQYNYVSWQDVTLPTYISGHVELIFFSAMNNKLQTGFWDSRYWDNQAGWYPYARTTFLEYK